MPLPIEQEKKIMTILHDIPDEKLRIFPLTRFWILES